MLFPLRAFILRRFHNVAGLLNQMTSHSVRSSHSKGLGRTASGYIAIYQRAGTALSSLRSWHLNLTLLINCFSPFSLPTGGPELRSSFKDNFELINTLLLRCGLCGLGTLARARWLGLNMNRCKVRHVLVGNVASLRFTEWGHILTLRFLVVTDREGRLVELMVLASFSLVDLPLDRRLRA